MKLWTIWGGVNMSGKNKYTSNATTKIDASEQIGLLTSILEGSIEHPIILSDLDCNILSWNEGAKRVFGYESAELISKSVFILHDIADTRTGKAQAIMEEVHKVGKWCGVLNATRKSGAKFMAFMVIILRRNSSGDPSGFATILRDLSEPYVHKQTVLESNKQPFMMADVLGMNHDVTEINKFCMQALLQDRLLNNGVLMAGVAHEINNPIAWILSNLNYLNKQFIRLKNEKKTTAHDWCNLEQVVMESIQGVERIRDIVRIFKKAGCINETSNTSVDIHTVLNLVIDMASLECKYRAKIETNFLSNIPQIIANSGQLHQVFLNLIINAAQAIPEGDIEHNKIRIITMVEKKKLRVDIQDTGEGINPDIIPHIFDPFFSTKPTGIGTGLGLAICHEIIGNLGGKINVQSELGKGATFSVYLPLDQSESFDEKNHLTS